MGAQLIASVANLLVKATSGRSVMRSRKGVTRVRRGHNYMNNMNKNFQFHSNL